MFDFSERIESFRDKKVRLSTELLDKLLAHRKANRDRLIGRLPDQIEGLTIGESSFRPQGSAATQTIIQTRFAAEEYDIDDGLVLWRHQLVKQDGTELTADEVKQMVREALKDDRFSKQPRICSNCVRVFYADTDEEKHHVDFPVYRGSSPTPFANNRTEGGFRPLSLLGTGMQGNPSQQRHDDVRPK